MTSAASSHLKTTIARNIRVAREEAGFTQRGLARLVNDVDSLAVSRWERGESRPSHTNFVALAVATAKPISWFYTDHEAA